MEAFDRLSPFWDVSLTMQGPNSGDRKRLERSNAKSYGQVPSHLSTAIFIVQPRVS